MTQSFTVKQLTRQIREDLETQFDQIWVKGEIYQFKKHTSGHMYFSLKEDNALIRCAFFRNRQRFMKTLPAEGQKIEARGQVSLYEPRGDMQLIISELREAGSGDLMQAFLQLKETLKTEGLFDSEHKKNLPLLPQKIALITSETGAVLQDMLTTLNHRYLLAQILLLPSAVQGDSAIDEITKNIARANQIKDIDLIILARGGGGLEDMQAFNSEAVARSIFSSQHPIVTAIGHETDFTISDMVADRHAPTPTAAAVLSTPDQQQLQRDIQQKKRTLIRHISHTLSNSRQRVDHTKSRLVRPDTALKIRRQLVNQKQAELKFILTNELQDLRQKNTALAATIKLRSPDNLLRHLRQTYDYNQKQLHQNMRNHLKLQQQKLNTLLEKMQLLSPKQTLKRGYALVTDEKNCVIHSKEQVKSGQKIHTELYDGTLSATIDTVE